MTIDKIKSNISEPILNHINSLPKEQLVKQQIELLKDIELIDSGFYSNINCNDLIRTRNIELKYIEYLIEKQ